jgi:phosphoglycerate dehydrogenase-like enzyme
VKTVLFSSIAADAIATALSLHGEVRRVDDPSGLVAALDGADALVMNNPAIYTAEFADQLCRRGHALRWLQLLSAGYDGPSLHGIPAGVILTNAGEAWSPTVAEHALALLLALMRRLPDCERAQQARQWEAAGIRPRLGSIEGRTVAILGYGSIGREITARLRPFGARIIGVTRSGALAAIEPRPDRMAPVSQLHDILREADVLIVTVPLSDATRHIIDAEALSCLPAHAVVVNVSRGGTVDPVALAAALRDGRLAGAALDVTEPEPLPADDPLWHAPNLIVTPHVAGFGSAMLAARIRELVAANARRFAAGQPLLHRVDVPVRAIGQP